MEHDRYWLKKAEECHRGSTDFLDTNFRKQWEDNLAHYNNEHTKDSRFHTTNYRNRNKLFRPKTRSIAIRGEAALARAMFGTNDLISVKAHDENDPMQLISSEINQELLQYRLTKTIPWYQTVIGAWQDTFNFGICISYEYWEFETERVEIETDDLTEDGDPAYRIEHIPLSNKPCIDLVPVENFRFDMGCDWRDVVGTSSFLERLVPLSMDEVLERMEEGSRSAWRAHSEAQIRAASREFDANQQSTRMAREGQGKQDPMGDKQLPKDYDTVWCREYIMRDDGRDWVFWTIGHQLILSDPKPIKEVYFHGKRPFTAGYSLLEAHKAIPKSRNELLAPLQTSVNKLANQRFDNVDLVLNKRYLLRRGQNIDTPALMRNVPGGGIVTDDPEKDVKVIPTPDVTSSSYEEHNRLATEMDEIGGNFSTSSVTTNRQMNETVGGMKMLRAGGDEIIEYCIVTFVKTWVEPVLRQLLWLEQAYEDDQVILGLAAGKSKQYRKTNLQGNVPLQLLMQDLILTVNIGINNTDPDQRLESFAKGLGTVIKLVPGVAPRLDEDEIIKYVLGGTGTADGQRFFKAANEVQPQMDPALAEAQAKHELERYKVDREIMLKLVLADHEDKRFYAKLAQEKGISLEKLYADVGLQEQAHTMQRAELVLRGLAEGNKMRELSYKERTGNDGI